MTRKDICSVDIEGLSKKNLRALIKVARTEWGQPIDLRSASEGSMCDYLRLYRQWKLDQEATEEPAAVEAVTHTLNDFEGIDSVTMQVTDWTAATPISCDVLSGQACDLPQPVEVCEVCGNDINEAEATIIAGVEEAVAPEPEPAELEIPESFNAIASRTIDILLQFGSGYGDIIDAGWIAGILKDCRWRSTIPNRLTEKLILCDPIFYGLAGIELDSLTLYQRILTAPEEFGDIPQEVKQGADLYRSIGSMFGADKLAQIAAYHSTRDNLNYLQQRLSISSLEPRSYAIRDRLFSTQDYNDQMALLDSDRRVLKAEAPRIAAYFQSLTSDYQLFHERDDESLEPLPEDFDLQAMMSHAFGCDYAWLHAESFEWQPHSDGGFRGHHVNRLDPDRISLCLNAWDGGEYVSFLRLVAHHPDPARRPWLAGS